MESALPPVELLKLTSEQLMQLMQSHLFLRRLIEESNTRVRLPEH